MIPVAEREDLLAVCERVRRDYPVIAGGLVDRHLADDDPAWPLAQKALGYVTARSSDGLATEIEAFATVSLDFLRLQARFMRTRRYARSGAQDLVEELYGDPEKMQGYYLHGLAMTYALWPNHARMIRFMSERFLPSLRPGARLVEVGVGHGLLSALAFEAVPDLDYHGVDISPSALEYADAALAHFGVDPRRRSMHHADALSGDVAALGGPDGFDALICCEVVEHVDQPEALLRRLAEAVAPTGVAFVSTVANMEADDHVYLFDDADQIRDTCRAAGWSILEDQPSILPGAESWDPLPVNYCAVLQPSAGV